MIDINEPIRRCLHKLADYQEVEHPSKDPKKAITVRVLKSCVLGYGHEEHRDASGRTWK